jgi:hypothetical protein
MSVTGNGDLLVSAVQNCYGLHLQSILDANGQPVTPGQTFGSASPAAFYANFQLQQPLAIDPNDPDRYYFASQTPHFRFGAPRPPMPGSPDFTINSTSPLLIASVGQPFTVSGWAKLKINGQNNKFAYLEQYWDKAYRLDASGNRVSETGQLSPYGEFFPTEPGPTELETMGDIDNPSQRETGSAHSLVRFCY